MTEPMTVDFSDPDFWQDPYPTWLEARRRARTALTPAGEPIVLTADDADTLLGDAVFAEPGLDSIRRLGITSGPFYEWRALTLSANDGEVHERLRGLVGRAFSPRRVERVREGLYEQAKSILEKATEVGQFDAVADFADELPLWLLCRFLGLPIEDYAEISGFLVGTEEGFTDPMTPERRARAEGGIVALYDYVERMVQDRREHPREDLITDLVQSEREGTLTRPELLALVVNIIGGAVGSTRAGLANSVYLLLSHRDQAEWVRDDPSRVRPAIEECLRYAPPFRAGRRKAVVTTSQFGLDFVPGDTAYLARPAVNRDPKRWSDPERFDVRRAEQRHFSFGYGPHFCLGQALARLDIQVSMQALLERLDDLELLIERPVRVPFTIDEQIEALPVAVRAR
jgi:cytochrome P450